MQPGYACVTQVLGVKAIENSGKPLSSPSKPSIRATGHYSRSASPLPQITCRLSYYSCCSSLNKERTGMTGISTWSRSGHHQYFVSMVMLSGGFPHIEGQAAGGLPEVLNGGCLPKLRCNASRSTAWLLLDVKSCDGHTCKSAILDEHVPTYCMKPTLLRFIK